MMQYAIGAQHPIATQNSIYGIYQNRQLCYNAKIYGLNVCLRLDSERGAKKMPEMQRRTGK
jgi:hypothetical protein